jgi:hypothetical protein
MRDEPRCWPRWLRGLTLACISALGLVAIVGSGGGVGFLGSICDTYPDSCLPPPPPPPSASIQPPYITAQVGTPVTYTVETSNFSGSLSYQWRRSSDGGSSFVEIPGATGKTYSLASVNLGDDGAVFVVTVTGSNGNAPSRWGHLAVSASPGIVFEDGEFLPADWLVSSLPDPGQVPFVHTEEQTPEGGNPGAFRKMVFQVPPGAGSSRLIYSSRSATYDPASQGAIYVIDYAEDCIALPSSALTYTNSSLAIEQGGRRYLANISVTDFCLLPTWSAVASRSSLRAQDFRLFDGPACNPGASCPDFSANAPPLHFGYWRISFGTAGDSVAHGIDNWRVTVWRR